MSLSNLHVKILCPPEAMLGIVFSAVDVLRLAGMVLKLRNPNALSQLSWEVVVPEGAPAMFDVSLAGMFSSPPPAEVTPERTVLLMPGLYAGNALELPLVAERYPALLDMFKDHVRQGGLVAACSTGLIYAALAGMLEQGMRLDVHWAFKAFFARRFPVCDFSAPEPMSFFPQLYTCVAPSQATEFMLAILSRLFDADVADGCGRLLQLQTQRQQLGNQLADQQWLSLTSDSPVYRAKQWLETHVDQAYNLAELAQVASSSERTLLRHFNTVFGMTPLEYLQDLRVQRARVMLEISINSMQTIANACGYTNAGTFSKLFRRAIGMTPGEYRKQHTFRTKRAHWRITPEG